MYKTLFLNLSSNEYAIRNSVSRFRFGRLDVTIAARSQREIPIGYKCKNIIANALSSYSGIRAQGKTYSDQQSATIMVFNHENLEWKGVISWLGEVI